MNRKKKNSPKQGKIIQGGMLVPQGMRQPDIVLQMPEIFMFDMNAYMQSVKAARGIDFSNRARLYDMYDSASLDLHLSGVIAKRMRGVTKIPIEFRRNGVPDDAINNQIKSPWFKQLRKDLVMSEFWGFTLVQFYLNEEGNIRDDFPDMLFVGSERDLGIYAELLPAVLYKRGDMSDWAQFCNIFGMPIREYTYDAGDEDARRRVIDDARRQGANAAYIHPKESELKLVEAGNKTGSSDLYRTFAEYWDSKMSIRVLGNTLTTDAKSTGTQALGSVHKEEEDEMNSDDRDFILDILNYDMRPVFASLGFNVEGGEFVYAKKDKINPAQQIDIVQKLSSMGLPIDDDYLYETFCVAKPDNYKQLKEEKEAAKAAFREQLDLQGNDNDKKKQDKNTDKTAFKQHLKSFFGLAPQHDKGANF